VSISDRISALNPAQRELLEALRRKSAAERPPAPAAPAPIAQRPPGDAWPLAPDQERLWFLYQLDPSDPSYNLPTATRLRGRLDAAALSRAIDEVVRRHEAWRTTFPVVDGRPLQTVAPPAPVPLPRIDLSNLPEAAREREASRLRTEASRRTFDLTRGPLLRALLVRLAPDLHELVLVVHHIVTDWYSFVVFWGEVQKLYPALLAGRPADLPELRVQYADFAVWQREQLSGPALQPHLDYWLRHLEGAPLTLELPTDRPRPAHFTTRGHRTPLRLTRAQSHGLKALSQRERVTPFMLVLALFQTLLSRWAGQEKVLVGAPNANRHQEELQGLLGFFLTQLVFSTDLGGDPAFREILGRVRQVALGAYAHQAVPFGKLVEALRPERDTSRPPIAQVSLMVLEASEEETPLSGLTTSAVDVDSGTSAFELTLALWDSPSGTFGYLEHNADLFDPTTGGRLAEGLLTLLDAVLERVDVPLSALPVQGEGAAHQALIEWNDTGAFQSQELLHTRFFAQAERTPGAVALIDGEESLTYGELAIRASALAERLRRMGIGPEARVAVCMPRSADLVTALLGVLAAGGAYVPVDPAYPREHQRFMLEDCGAAVVIEEKDLKDIKDPKDKKTGEGPVQSFRSFRSFSSPDTLAYLIYTSGSTGRPKAVGITHHNAAALVDWALATFPDDLSGGVLASTSICFDLSVYEIFGTLSCGGTVILAENALALPELPAAGRVGLINTVPSALAELLRLGPLPPSVRTISLCGEPFSRHLADEIEARGIRRAVNYYGPTEDTVYSTWTQVPQGERLEPAIGRSITGSRAYLLDRGLRPVPLGARGDLYLAGDGLARGYLGRPDLTAERFVPDPVAEIPGGRMYRTGDLARWRAAGQLEFFGRADRQVKVRGFRVEPAEIEAVLAELPGVADVAVDVRDGRLAAWLVPREGIAGEDLVEGARSAVLDRLPRHMIPALWAHLPALPHTPNGKLDHRALLLPDAARPQEDMDGYVPPRGPAEELLAGIWAEILGLPRVGVHDNFFRLGGDSILSIRVVARARQAGLEISPRQVFERQTVAELAAAAAQIEQTTAPAATEEPSAFSLARLDPEFLDRLLAGDPAIEDLYPLSPMQAGLLFHGLYAPATEIYFEQITCTLRGDLDAEAFRRAWQRLVDRHGVLRTSFLWEGLDEPLQMVRRGVEMPWAEEDWRGTADPDSRLAAFAAADRRDPFDLRRAPLMRAALLRTDEREHRFVWSFHHLLVDGWSLPPLFADVFALYQDECLPPPALTYRDFVAWLARRDRAADERYWRQALAGISGPTPLPWDATAPPSARADEFSQHEILLPEPATATLAAFARERGLTLNTVLQGAWALLLSRWSGEREVVFGAVAAGRPPELPGFESAIGLFINTLPVRIEADPVRPLAAWLGAIQSAQSEARHHEQAPLAEIQRWSGAAGREPLFQSLLVFENYPLDPAVAERTGALELSDVHAVERTSFPLSLAIIPGPRLRLRITHDRLLEPATGDRLLAWLTRLLDRFVAGPDLPLESFELLSDAEREQLSRPVRSTPAPEDHVLQRFEHWVAATPDAPAVRDAAETLTFAELDLRATELARELRPESFVGLPATRSVDQLVGVLAIWKAGAAWVPLDPAQPRERTEMILRDCATAVGRDSAAYALYTSGSTGTPKGVVVDHSALAAYLSWVDEVLLGPVDHHLPATSGLTFDASLKQLLGPLLAGREVRILPEETATQPAALASALATERFAAFNGVPALWSAVLEAIESGEAPVPGALQRVLLGGEALPPDLVERTRRLLPRVEVWNLYGPTEATANATAARISPGDPITLGEPLPGVSTLVLDPEGRLVPPGGVGELCLADIGLARGYLGRPDLTAERFLPYPFAATPGERLYRSGDLVRLRIDGRLEHRGRIDTQVKVRGIRIELGEIEAALRRHPAVRDAVVTARKDAPGETRLAAWIAMDGSPVPAADLRTWLRERLPAAAVPADLVVLPDLPRLPSGKADRRALASRVPEIGDGRPFEAPANDVEETLAGIWRELLRVERAGRGDNFFELGGHSLLATRLMVRVRDQLGVEISLPAIFAAENLAALAQEILALRLRAENPDDLAHLMAELNGLSDDQIESLLAELPGEQGPEGSFP